MHAVFLPLQAYTEQNDGPRILDQRFRTLHRYRVGDICSPSSRSGCCSLADESPKRGIGCSVVNGIGVSGRVLSSSHMAYEPLSTVAIKEDSPAVYARGSLTSLHAGSLRLV